jgi:hypothetical protein
LQGFAVDIPFELDYLLHRVPKAYPTPIVKLWLLILVQFDPAVIAFEAEQKPFLFLANTKRVAVLTDEILGKSIVQPILSLMQNLYIGLRQANFFIQLSKQGLFHRLALLNPALRKLPRTLPYSFRPQQLSLPIANDNANI